MTLISKQKTNSSTEYKAMPTFVGASQYCREISCTAISISPYIGPYWHIRTIPRRNTNHKKDIVSRTGESQSRKYIRAKIVRDKVIIEGQVFYNKAYK